MTSCRHTTSKASSCWVARWRRWTTSATPAAAARPCCARCLHRRTGSTRSDGMTSMRTRDATIRELLDADTLDADALDRNLRDIRFINAVLGWRAYTVRAVARHVRHAGLPSLSLVDVASGSADMPLAIARWAACAGIAARIVATDISPQIVAIASLQVAAVPAIAVQPQHAPAL